MYAYLRVPPGSCITAGCGMNERSRNTGWQELIMLLFPDCYIWYSSIRTCYSHQDHGILWCEFFPGAIMEDEIITDGFAQRQMQHSKGLVLVHIICRWTASPWPLSSKQWLEDVTPLLVTCCFWGGYGWRGRTGVFKAQDYKRLIRSGHLSSAGCSFVALHLMHTRLREVIFLSVFLCPQDMETMWLGANRWGSYEESSHGRLGIGFYMVESLWGILSRWMTILERTWVLFPLSPSQPSLAPAGLWRAAAPSPHSPSPLLLPASQRSSMHRSDTQCRRAIPAKPLC